MLREISRKVDYVAEGIELLRHLGGGEKYAALQERLTHKYGCSFKKSEINFKLLMQIEREAEHAFLKEAEIVRYYFGKGEGEDCVGRVLLLWDEYKGADYKNTDALAAYLEGLTEQDYCEKFGICLQQYGDLFREDSEFEKMREPINVISYLMKMEVKDEEKWKLQTVFMERKEHQEKVMKLLHKAVEVLSLYGKELEECTGRFYQYWKKSLAAESFVSLYLKDRMQAADMEENPLGYRIRPAIIQLNAFGLHIDMDEKGHYQKPDNIRIGILFDDEFDIASRVFGAEKEVEGTALQALKLFSDKSKFEILSYIRDRRAYGSELAKHLNLTTATISHHMGALVVAGLVHIEKEDNRIYYRANKEEIEKVLIYCRKVLTGAPND